MSALQFPSDEKVQAAEAATETKTMRWSELHTGDSLRYHMHHRTG